MKPIEIQQITQLPEQVVALEKEAVAEGFRFLTRLISEWHSGTNRFDAPGECLMAAYSDQQLVGIGGLSIDPYGTLIPQGCGVYTWPLRRGINMSVGRW